MPISIHGPSTRRRALKLQRFFPFTLNGVTSRFAELHCGSVALLCSRCSLQKLRKVLLLKLGQKRQPIKSYASTSSSQSNRVLVCPGREIHVIGCWSSFRHARRQASTHAAVWTLRDTLFVSRLLPSFSHRVSSMKSNHVKHHQCIFPFTLNMVAINKAK